MLQDVIKCYVTVYCRNFIEIPYKLRFISIHDDVNYCRQLTHGMIQKLTNSGRVADCWEGATVEMSKRLGSSSHNLIDRQGMTYLIAMHHI